MRLILFCSISIVFLVFPQLSQADSTRVLYLGDSLSLGAFGRTVDSGLRSEGVEVFTHVAGGASPYYWLKAHQSLPCSIGYWEKTPYSERRIGYLRAVPKLEDLMDTHDPHYVVVQTGINIYATLRSRRRPKEQNVAEVSRLIEQMCHSIHTEGSTSYWILPPHSHEQRYNLALQNELKSIMRTAVEKYGGLVFESGEVTKYTESYPSNDGIHFGPKEAADWGIKVRADLSSHIRENPNGLAVETLSHAQSDELAAPIEADTVMQSAAIPRKKTTILSMVSLAGKISKPEKPDLPPAVAESIAADAADAADDTPIEQLAPKEEAPTVAEAPPATEFVEVHTFDYLDLDLELQAKSTIDNISQIDYANALGAYEYKVTADRIGNYPYEKIRVAHGIVFNRNYTPVAKREIGSTISLRLVPISTYSSLKTWQLKDDLETDYESPLYTPQLY